jgi:hypothetical protein
VFNRFKDYEINTENVLNAIEFDDSIIEDNPEHLNNEDGTF